MNTAFSLSESFNNNVEQPLIKQALAPYTHKLYLVIASHSAIRRVLNIAIAQFALEGPVCVLDGGNLFDFYTIAHFLRLKTTQLEEALKRVEIARAFTCYQVITLLNQTKETQYPIVILDLLSTFYDENVDFRERNRLFQQSVHELHRLCAKSPLIVSATAGEGEAGEFVDHLEEVCSQVWHSEPAPSIIVQPRLF